MFHSQVQYDFNMPRLLCRMAEHSFVSKRADDERSKRPQYKAIIEHDGLPRKQLSNQVLNM